MEKSSMKVRIRNYKDSDYPQVQKNLQEADMYSALRDSRENYASMIKANPDLVLVATYDKEIIGSVVIIPYGVKEGFLFRLVVKENYRNQGVGKKLLQASANVLKKKGARQLVLFVEADRKDLHEYYEKQGFKKVRDLVAMWKPLSK